MSVVTKNEYWQNEAQNNKAKNPIGLQYATVTRLDGGKPRIRFIGDAKESEKVYVYFKSYVPAIGDRVQLLDNIIIGGWKP